MKLQNLVSSQGLISLCSPSSYYPWRDSVLKYKVEPLFYLTFFLFYCKSHSQEASLNQAHFTKDCDKEHSEFWMDIIHSCTSVFQWPTSEVNCSHPQIACFLSLLYFQSLSSLLSSYISRNITSFFSDLINTVSPLIFAFLLPVGTGVFRFLTSTLSSFSRELPKVRFFQEGILL